MAQKENINENLIRIAGEFVSSNKDAVAWITENVSYNMREMIRQNRRYYFGVFEEPNDPVTGHRKTFVPLTQSLCETVLKNIDLDTKDINLRAKNVEAIPFTALMRNYVKNELDSLGFGEMLDDTERSLTIDGTIVWKTWEGFDEDRKRKAVKTKKVDLLNFFIDPLAESIQKTPLVAERAVMQKSEFMAMDGWDNKEDATFETNLHPNDENLTSDEIATKEIEVYEVWGMLPINGEDKPREMAHMVVSNLFQNAIIHLVEKVDKIPYEEAWLRRVPGRWYGMGVPEQIWQLQEWMNTTINVRINRARFSQLGIFLMRKGSGLTPSMLSKFVAGGVIPVNATTDIQQLPMQEASVASYNDENVIQGWAERVTQAFDIIAGEQLPASTPATNALIQNRNAQSAFVLIREQLGMFLQRWMERQAFPIMQKTIRRDDVVRISGDTSELKAFDEKIANTLLFDRLQEMVEEGKAFDEAQVMQEKERIMEKLNTGENRFMKILKDPKLSEYDIEFYVTNEEFDKGVLVQNLFTALQLRPDLSDTIISRVFDIMGLDTNQLERAKNQQPLQAQQPLQQAPAAPVSEQEQFVEANTL